MTNMQVFFLVWEFQNLEPQTTIYKWMFDETTIFYIKIWNHPIETTIYKWLFGVPGKHQRTTTPWGPLSNKIGWNPSGESSYGHRRDVGVLERSSFPATWRIGPQVSF